MLRLGTGRTETDYIPCPDAPTTEERVHEVGIAARLLATAQRLQHDDMAADALALRALQAQVVSLLRDIGRLADYAERVVRDAGCDHRVLTSAAS
jgi:hypothetical protein